jgi:hypothetical protein
MNITDKIENRLDEMSKSNISFTKEEMEGLDARHYEYKRETLGKNAILVYTMKIKDGVDIVTYEKTKQGKVSVRLEHQVNRIEKFTEDSVYSMLLQGFQKRPRR